MVSARMVMSQAAKRGGNRVKRGRGAFIMVCVREREKAAVRGAIRMRTMLIS